MRGKIQIVYLLVFVLALSGLLLTACSEESIFKLPQKVTIEKKDSETSASASSGSSATSAEEADAESATTESASAGSTSAENTSSTTSATSGSAEEATSSSSSSSSVQEGQPEVLIPVGIVPADPEALTESAKKDVVEAANHRLDTGYYSRETLIAGLISDGFSEEEATYGADNCYVTWGVPGWYDNPANATTGE